MIYITDQTFPVPSLSNTQHSLPADWNSVGSTPSSKCLYAKLSGGNTSGILETLQHPGSRIGM